jgi:hypothetical protein
MHWAKNLGLLMEKYLGLWKAVMKELMMAQNLAVSLAKRMVQYLEQHSAPGMALS